jgi:hypothetical protein
LGFQPKGRIFFERKSRVLTASRILSQEKLLKQLCLS